MKKSLVLLLMLSFSAFAQVADVAENISPLLIGEKIPNVILQDVNGKDVQTKSIVNKKTVLVFYRGGWCPYCNAQLSEMQEIESDILKLGYQIVAISPDSPNFLKETTEKDKLKYQLFSDADGNLAKGVGIAFKAPEKYSKMLGKYSDGKNNEILPVPTVYVINADGEIEFMYINPNYKNRLKGKMLLSVLNNL